MPVAAVITLVSHRLHRDTEATLLCPWFALTANNDDIYPSNWATKQLLCGEARWWKVVDDDHYLCHRNREAMDFICRVLTELHQENVQLAAVEEREFTL